MNFQTFYENKLKQSTLNVPQFSNADILNIINFLDSIKTYQKYNNSTPRSRCPNRNYR